MDFHRAAIKVTLNYLWITTGSHSGAVSIIRISGPDAVSTARVLFRRAQVPLRPPSPFLPKSHRVYYGHLIDASGQTVDEALLLAMLRPKSYTCEDVIELHCHGGGVSAQRVLDLCLANGCRLARPGEFTLRAFLNGRLDLSQAESVAQLVTAKTVTAADSALAGLQVRDLCTIIDLVANSSW
jgi:tRNA modification GTPase